MQNAQYYSERRYKKDIYLLSKSFSYDFFKFLRKLKINFSSKHILDQIYRSSSSISANLTEATHSGTKKELARKLSISLGEALETEHWLEYLFIEYPQKNEELTSFKTRLSEIIAILSASVKKLRNKI